MLCFIKIKKLIGQFLLPLVFLFLFSPQALALNLISDEETESFLQKIIQPIFKKAQIPYNKNKIFIVDDPSLNAFVSEGNFLFIHTGTIIAADTPNEIQGVLAHETGHILGGHLISQHIFMQEMQKVNIASLLLAGGAAAASGNGDVAAAIALGGQSSLMNRYFQYRTEQERSADESAVNLLTQLNQPTNGLYDFMKKIQKNNQLSGIEEIPYFRTHPVTQERLAFLKNHLSQKKSENAALVNEFGKVKAKLIAFLSAPEYTFRIYPLNHNDEASLYAHAIAYFKKLDIDASLQKLNQLISLAPKNPYYRELKAQILMETGSPQLAKNEYLNALKLKPDSALFKIAYAQAALETQVSPKELNTIALYLNQAVIESDIPLTWILLSRTYALQNKVDYAQYAAAEYSLKINQTKVAEKQLEKAKKITNSAQLKLKISDLEQRIKNKKSNL